MVKNTHIVPNEYQDQEDLEDEKKNTKTKVFVNFYPCCPCTELC